jgi:pimeloyl-ACP methyl ester carboxylesterase
MSDGAIINVAVHGPADAPPIVLSHGWCERGDYWNPQINELAGQYRVITYDHRGHGRSTIGRRRFDITVLADDFAEVLDATLRPGERAVLAGHSMGGMTIMAWAGRHPEQAGYAGAVLLASTGYHELIETSTLFPVVPAGSLPRSVSVTVLGSTLPFPPLPLLRPVVKWRIMPSGGREEVDFCARMFASCPPAVRGNWGRALASLALPGPSPIPDVPTTVFVGDRDHLTPQVHAQKIAAALSDAGNLERLVIVPGIGHESNVEVPDRFNAELRHLARLAGRSRPAEAAG